MSFTQYLSNNNKINDTVYVEKPLVTTITLCNCVSATITVTTVVTITWSTVAAAALAPSPSVIVDPTLTISSNYKFTTIGKRRPSQLTMYLGEEKKYKK